MVSEGAQQIRNENEGRKLLHSTDALFRQAWLRRACACANNQLARNARERARQPVRLRKPPTRARATRIMRRSRAHAHSLTGASRPSGKCRPPELGTPSSVVSPLRPMEGSRSGLSPHQGFVLLAPMQTIPNTPDAPTLSPNVRDESGMSTWLCLALLVLVGPRGVDAAARATTGGPHSQRKPPLSLPPDFELKGRPAAVPPDSLCDLRATLLAVMPQEMRKHMQTHTDMHDRTSKCNCINTTSSAYSYTCTWGVDTLTCTCAHGWTNTSPPGHTCACAFKDKSPHRKKTKHAHTSYTCKNERTHMHVTPRTYKDAKLLSLARAQNNWTPTQMPRNKI